MCLWEGLCGGVGLLLEGHRGRRHHGRGQRGGHSSGRLGQLGSTLTQRKRLTDIDTHTHTHREKGVREGWALGPLAARWRCLLLYGCVSPYACDV